MISFMEFINLRYSKIIKEREMRNFNYWDDYAIFLFEDICDKDEEEYYEILEKDIKVFSDMQTGSERENEKGKISSSK